jgi:hypothetical protein
MWFRRRRRRQPPLPVLLPSLDRLAELIERVVELLDQVSLAPVPVPESTPEREGEIVLKQHNLETRVNGWVALVPSPEGYRLLQRDGLPPDRGAALELDEGSFVVLRLGPSPLPADRRRCAYLEQEPPSGERTFDR